MNKYVIIVAGGIGSRMGSDTPKQFLLLHNKPVLLHTFEAFIKADPSINIILVLHPKCWDDWERICKEYNFSHPHELVKGGQTRFHSVLNGLSTINDNNNGIVAVHDAARPIVSKELINSCFTNTINVGSTIPVVKMVDSIRMIDHQSNLEKSHVINRASIRRVQTPQCFKLSLLKEAYKQPYNSNFTDDASVIEAGNLDQINLIDGEESNIKITNPIDLIIAEEYLKKY